MNINKIEELADIIIKIKLNVATPQQRERLQAWLYANDNNLKIYSSIMSGEFLASKYMMEEENIQIYNTIDVKREIIRKITLNQKKNSKFVLLKRLSVASVAVGLLWGGSETYEYINDALLMRQSDSERRILAHDIKSYHTGNKAILETSDGKKIELAREIDAVIENKSAALSDNDEIKESYNTITTPKGVNFNVTLSDGTKVWLNSESKVTYPVKFSNEDSTRDVTVMGEAYFEVARDTNRPFIVHGVHNNIVVVGTKFNINTSNVVTTTTLVEGSVIIQKESRTILLKPSQQATATHEVKVQDVDVSSYIAWKDNKYIFKGKRLSEVMSVLSTWYDIEVEYDESRVEEISFTGVLSKLNTFDEIIEILEATELFNIKIKNNRTVKVYAKH